jgi:hypothetical protein
LLTKTLLQCQFGKPHEWTQQYFDSFQRLDRFGWDMKVFTTNPWPSQGNVEIVQMSLAEYDGLLEKYCGINPKNFINEAGVPNKVTSDHYPAYGWIFQDFIKDADFWGFTNWDMVYGRLSDFVPDEVLASCDIWSDDVNAINGIFSLFRNDPRINRLFEQVPDWRSTFVDHAPCGFDEHQMTRTVQELSAAGEIRFLFPRPFPYHSYDRLSHHVPEPRVYFDPSGALIERFSDVVLPNKEVGREIMSFHFSRTKKWPVAA